MTVVPDAFRLRLIESCEAADRYLNPNLNHLHDPYLMAGMEAAVLRLRRALEHPRKSSRPAARS